MGTVFNDRWIVARLNCQFICEQKPSIEFVELFALTAAILSWTNMKELQNTRCVIFCDNEAVVHMINKKVSSCRQCMKLIRLLVLEDILANRKIRVRHIKSADNVLSDALSRLDFKRFWKHAPPSMNKKADLLPATIWPPEKLWFS